jgi:hypothetical protein
MMRSFALFGMLCLAVAPTAAQTVAGTTCVTIGGKLNEFILPQASAPTDPFGRILGTVKGTLEGSLTAFLTTFVPSPSGDVSVTNNHAFVTLEGNQLFTRGAAYWTWIKTGYYQVDMTLVIAGGTGKYTNATGSIHLLGVGDAVGPGTGQFVDEYHGQICAPAQ